MAEEFSKYLSKFSIRCRYIHSDIDTLERIEILHELKEGIIDVLIGVNLLREGLDLPEVSLVAIMDADKEGFLRSDRALTQIQSNRLGLILHSLSQMLQQRVKRMLCTQLQRPCIQFFESASTHPTMLEKLLPPLALIRGQRFWIMPSLIVEIKIVQALIVKNINPTGHPGFITNLLKSTPVRI